MAESIEKLPPCQLSVTLYGRARHCLRTHHLGAMRPYFEGRAGFGTDQVLFGTDMPFDPEKGAGFIRETIRCIDQMRASPEEKAKIYEGNARRLLKLKLR